MIQENNRSLLATILKGTDYALTIFNPQEIASLELFRKESKTFLTCAITGRARLAKPEEIVRQLYVNKLMKEYGYPKERIGLEKSVQFGSAVHEKKADIVIYEKETIDTEYIVVEVKKPKRKDGLEQLKSYCNALGSPIGVWTNGGETLVLHRQDPNIFRNLVDIPSSDQTLGEMLDEKWTIQDLTANNRLVTERLSLKEVIQDMENLVLTGAGVDAFEEVFKLIYAKLFDEWNAARGGKQPRYLEFRVGGSTAKQFAEKIENLLRRAMVQWPGVFVEGESINLDPAHLLTCGSFLEDIKLFNSNLQIIDEAFEYLSIKAAKGEKGQYFTPRHVIDMCVKMVNPTEDEYVIDTAAGSCGFTVHTIFHVWGEEFKVEGPDKWQSEYAATHVYGLDFDPRSIKIARALNLIAGDGKTNVYRANTLDPRMWSEEVRVGLKDRLLKLDDPERNKWNRQNYRYFDFDLLLTNPPFAGDVKDSRVLHQYELARKESKWRKEVSRDILFIERNLEFLRPGGRAAIVLPQGRYNNVTDNIVREYISRHARILAVVSLHINTFKPHANTKTSVIFLQKWNNDAKKGPLCPRIDDYPIFFGVSRNAGKNNIGDYTYQMGSDNAPLLDSHGHMIVHHDLDEIATAFVKWAEQERLSFHAKRKINK